MSDLNSITEDILNARLNEDELLQLNKLIVDEVKEARRRDARRTISKLKPGSRAKVVGRLSGNAYFGETGEVVKINRTTVTMNFEGDYGVRIPASVLEPA